MTKQEPDREYRISELNPAIKKRIKEYEEKYQKQCYKIWTFTNPNQEQFLFGRFGKLKDDNTIITLGHFNPDVLGGFMPQYGLDLRNWNFNIQDDIDHVTP